MTHRSDAPAPLAPSALQAPHDHEEFHDDIIHPSPVPFVIVHLVCLAAIWTDVTATALWICLAFYVIRMFGITAGYHRYFSHRSFKTGRVFQFVLAWIAQASAQRGALWWAAKHRHHHRHSDTPDDVHSPRHRGFWYSHLGWIFTNEHDATDFDAVPDLTKYPELVWLEKHDKWPAVSFALVAFLIGGWPGVIVGFFWSTVLTYHGTFFINSLAHVHGSQRYVTGDDSRNNWWLAIITLGEGWHNNHHAYQRATRQGFRWYEFDPTFYVLKALSWARVVWDLGEAPADVVANTRPLGRHVIEKVARQLAEAHVGEAVVRAARERLAHANADAHAWLDARRTELATRRDAAVHAVAERLHALHLPHLPTREELRARFLETYAETPSLDEIVERARARVLEQVAVRVLAEPAPSAA